VSDTASESVPAGALVPRVGWLRLRFPDALESEFLMTYRAAARRWVRMSVFVALSTTLGFAVIDHWVLVGPHAAQPDIVRFGLQLPIVVIMIVLTSERFYSRWYQPAVQIAAPLFGLGTVLMAIEATPEQLPLVAARLVLATFYFYFMLGLRFHAALRTNVILVAAYTLVAVVGGVTKNVAIYQIFVLFCANLIGGAGCYALEYSNRIAFLDRRRLTEVAMHDGLTGLLNRAALDDQVRRLWRHAERDRLPVSVALIDIDHFKAYNDRYGHQAGDQCLRDVAVAVRQAARRRPLDMVARYGGEELIAVLFGGDRMHAESVARGVLDAVANLRIPHTASPTRPFVTVSVGVATLEPGTEYSHDLAVQLADRALYAAKERGRNGWSGPKHNSNGNGAPESDGLLKTAS
jgi:diguanylate cyclase (GGDEF)-like protein